MSAKSFKASNSRVLTHPAVVLWLASLFLFVLAEDCWDSLILLLAFMVVPVVALGVWLAGVPIYVSWMTLARLSESRWREALRYFAVLPVGAVIAFVGLKCGDFITVMTYGPILKHEVEAVKKGAPPKDSNGIFSSSVMAFKMTGGFLGASVGVAYDKSGRADRMMALPPSARPSDWQKDAVDVMKCQGIARHLFYNFYKITVGSYSGC